MRKETAQQRESRLTLISDLSSSISRPSRSHVLSANPKPLAYRSTDTSQLLASACLRPVLHERSDRLDSRDLDLRWQIVLLVELAKVADNLVKVLVVQTVLTCADDSGEMRVGSDP